MSDQPAPFGRREYDGSGLLTYRWLATVVGALVVVVVLGLLGIIYAQLTASLAAQETRLTALERQVERIVRVETRLDSIERQLGAMESKLDRALERRP